VSRFDEIDLAQLRERRSYKWRAYPADVLPAFVAEMDFALADCVKRALIDAVERDDCGYAYPGGLVEAFVEFAAAYHGWQVDPDRVFMVADVMAGVDAVLRLGTEPGDGVVINTPVYPPFFEHITVQGRRVVEAPLAETSRGWQLDFDVIEQAFAAGARAYLLCNPHNPTGIVATKSDLERIASLADRYGVLVLSDEIHAPIAMPGAVHIPYAGLGDDAARTAVTLTSASKAFNLAGLKCAVIVAGSEEMRQSLASLPEGVGFAAGLLGVIASVAAWREGRTWLSELVDYLDTNRRHFADLLSAKLPGAEYVPPQAGYLAWVDCRALGLGADPREAFLRDGRVALRRGLDFGAPGAGFVRVTLGTSAVLLEEIVERMARALPSKHG
jgi:cystathionine beta-lyase